MRRPGLAVFAALATLSLAGCKVDADFSEAAPTPVILPAEDYEGEITAIDRLAFAPEPLTKKRRTDLGARLEGLAARIKTASPERFIALEALELRALAGRARSLPDAPPPQRFQNEWMRIRNNLFDDRAWFARSAADLEAASPGQPATQAVTQPATPEPVAHESAMAPTPGRAPDAAPPLSGLDGRWVVREIFANGKTTFDDELSGAEWTFAGDELTMRSPHGKSSRFALVKVQDENGSALHLRTVATNAGPDEKGWMIYQLAGAKLTVAFFDGLGARPAGFIAPEGRPKPMLLVVALER